MNTKLVVAVAAGGYAIIRYGIAKGIPFENWPAFIGSKAMAIAAVLFLVLAIYNRIHKLENTKEYLLLSLFLGMAHGLTSAAMFNEAYYAYLHIKGTGKFNVFGELTIVFGALALAYFFFAGQRARETGQSSDLPLLSILLVHVFSVGILKWIDLNRWQYGLVPISLLGFIALLVGLVIVLRRRSV